MSLVLTYLCKSTSIVYLAAFVKIYGNYEEDSSWFRGSVLASAMPASYT